MTKLTRKVLESAPATWNNMIQGRGYKPTAVWQATERELDGIAQQAVMLSQYLSTRLGTDGSGGHSHAEAVRKANRRLVKVRRAMGYSLPESAKLNF